MLKLKRLHIFIITKVDRKANENPYKKCDVNDFYDF